MNFDGNFRRIGSANTEPVKALVEVIDAEQWDSDTLRQRWHETSRDVRTIALVHDDDFRHTQPTRHPMLKVFEAVIRPVLAVTADYYDSSTLGRALTEKNGAGYFVRANLVCVSPGGVIPERRDDGFSLTHAHCVHVPIVTSDAVSFAVGSETLNIPTGEIYEINNRRAYALRNDGDVAAVHLALDYVLKGEMCCCGSKLHPNEPCSPEACAATDRGEIPCACLPESP